MSDGPSAFARDRPDIVRVLGAEPPDRAGSLGLLVLDGLLVRWVSVG